MPTTNDHVRAAERNERFAERVVGNLDAEDLPWAIVGLFYAAVHYGRAYIIESGGPTITSHIGFESHFLRVSADRGLYSNYRNLKDESERARYDCATYTREDFRDIKRRHLTPWRTAMRKMLGL